MRCPRMLIRGVIFYPYFDIWLDLEFDNRALMTATLDEDNSCAIYESFLHLVVEPVPDEHELLHDS
jgi:hypothetical protein